MVAVNESSWPGMVIVGMTDATGSIFLTLLIIVFFLMLIGLAFRLPLEFSAILVFPLLLTLMAYDATFMSAFGVLALYLGVLLGKNLFFT